MTKEPNVFDQSAHTNFTQIPNLVLLKRISHTALHLYLWYKAICGESGSCWQSLDTTSKGCDMSVPTVIKCRRELEDVDLISTKTKRHGNGSTTVLVYITDIWEENKGTVLVEKGLNNLIGPIKKIDSAGERNFRQTRSPSNKRHAKACRGSKTAPPPRNKLLTDEDWEMKAARELWTILEKADADLVTRLRTRVGTFAKQIIRLNTKGKIPKEEIKIIFAWLRDNYIDNHTPKLRKVVDLYNNWGRIREARLRWLEDSGEFDPSGNGSAESEVTAMDVYEQLQMLGVAIDYDQGDIDLAAGMLQVAEGVFTAKDMPG